MESSTILYDSVISFLRTTAPVTASHETKEYYTGTIRDGPHAFFLFCCIILSVFGTILNGVTIATIKSLPSRIRQDATHTFILNLSIADLLLSCVVIPSHWLQIVYRKVDVVGEAFCVVSQIAFFWIFELSLFTLSVVSINRMVKICYNPSYSRIFTTNVIRCLVASLWITSFLLVLPPAFGIYGSYEIFASTKASGKYYCGIENSSKSPVSPSAFYYTIGFVVPLITFTISYFKILRKVNEHRAHFHGSSSNTRNYKLFQTIVVIFLSFIVCFLPNLIFRGWMSYTARFRYLRQLIKSLMYSSALLNPLIYFSMNSEYQKAFSRLVARTKGRLGIGEQGVVTTTSHGPESKSSDREPETAGTPCEGSSNAGDGHGMEVQEVGVVTRMTALRRPESPKDIVICYSAAVAALSIFALIADFIRHRRLPDELFERQRVELAGLD